MKLAEQREVSISFINEQIETLKRAVCKPETYNVEYVHGKATGFVDMAHNVGAIDGKTWVMYGVKICAIMEGRL